MSDAGCGVSVIGGYLGSGKTTLVNHLLEHCRDRRLAVLVNDFGAIAIDARLIVSRSATVIGISGGCVCCAYGSDLIGALQTLADGQKPPDSVVIETSGVALPRIVLQSAVLVPGMTASGVTVVADAETLLVHAADRFLADTVTRQVRDADVVLLNKVHRVSSDEARRAEDWIRMINPGADVVRTERSRVDPDRIISGEGGGRTRRDAIRLSTPLRHYTYAEEASRTDAHAHAHAPAAQQFSSEAFVSEGAVDVEWLAHELARPEHGLLRAKGLLRDRDGVLRVLQVVGDCYEVTAATNPAQRSESGLVVIGKRGELNRAEIARLIAAAATSATETS